MALNITTPESKTKTLILDSATTAPKVNQHETVYQEAEFIPLATKGLFLPGELKGIDKIKMRKLNWEDENLLATQSYYENGTIFNELLNAACVDEVLSPEDLTAIDREVIILWLRMTAMGVDYTISNTCENINIKTQKPCKHKNKRTWDLNSFEMPAFSKEVLNILTENENSYPVELKSIGKTVYVSYPSYAKEAAVYKALVESSVEDSPKLITAKYASWISKVIEPNGTQITNWVEIVKWLSNNKFSLADSRLLKKAIMDLTLEIDTRKTFKCAKCKHVEEDVELPISITFFWPE